MGLSPRIEYGFQKPVEIFPEIEAGRRLVLVGTSEKGELYEPIIIYNKGQALEVFGSGQLVDFYESLSLLSENSPVVLLRTEDKGYLKALRALSSLDFDLVYLGSIVDDFDSKIDPFIELCKEKERAGSLVHGFFKLSLSSDKDLLYSKLKSLSFDNDSASYENGKYFSLVMDQFKSSNSAVVYATLVADLDVGASPVNKPLNVELSHHFTKREIQELHRRGIVCFRDSIVNNVVCASPTCAVLTIDSAHKNIANYRVVQSMMQEFKERVNHLVGNPFSYGGFGSSVEAQEIMDQLIDEYIRDQIIRAAEYSVQENELEGYIHFHLKIVPIFSVEYISAYPQLRIYR